MFPQASVLQKQHKTLNNKLQTSNFRTRNKMSVNLKLKLTKPDACMGCDKYIVGNEVNKNSIFLPHKISRHAGEVKNDLILAISSGIGSMGIKFNLSKLGRGDNDDLYRPANISEWAGHGVYLPKLFNLTNNADNAVYFVIVDTRGYSMHPLIYDNEVLEESAPLVVVKRPSPAKENVIPPTLTVPPPTLTVPPKIKIDDESQALNQLSQVMILQFYIIAIIGFIYLTEAIFMRGDYKNFIECISKTNDIISSFVFKIIEYLRSIDYQGSYEQTCEHITSGVLMIFDYSRSHNLTTLNLITPN